MRQRGVQIGAPFKVPSYLVHPLVVPSVHLISRSNTARAPDTSKGPIYNRVLDPLLRSVTNWVLPWFALSHLGGNLTLLDCELGAPSLHSSAPRGARSRFARLLNGCSVTSFLRTLGGQPHFARSLTILRFPL